MGASNYDDILGQLRDRGLLVDGLEFGRLVRCHVEGDREKRGWYAAHEITGSDGDQLIIGSGGVWSGNDPGTFKFRIAGKKLSPEQRAAFKTRAAEDRKLAAAQRRKSAAHAADRADKAWREYAIDGESEYLALKGVAGYGVRYTKANAVVVPVADVSGRVHGLQFLRSPKQAKAAQRPKKEFWPAGMVKQGHFHLIGMPTDVVFVAEGYATGASVHAASSGKPVAIAFDAGNLPAVAQAMRKRFRRAAIVLVADDDCFTAGNPGVTAAQTAALAVHGTVFVPKWKDDAWRRAQHAEGKAKLTDANDLAATDGMAALSAQLEAHLVGVFAERGVPPRAEHPTMGAGASSDVLTPLQGLDDLLPRYSLIYGHGGAVFDAVEHRIIAMSDMRDLCARRELHRAWMEHPSRRIVRPDEVGFDPAGQDPKIKCNLWAGWPTESKAGKCERLLELLWYLCSAETKSRELYEWVLRWLAYPIQNPGAKMKSCLVLHGSSGVGKNMFFEAYMHIYGRYGRVIDQNAIEDKFNDWASGRLFLIADEVVARSDLYHVKNKLKAFITGDWIRINPKQVAAYDERNHVNIVFLSNELMPVVLEQDDRRHAVMWTPKKLSPQFYHDVADEIAAGGSEALHDYLLHVEMGDFHPASEPPMTDAKQVLIEQSLDNAIRFHRELCAGEIGDVEVRPCLTTDAYELYKLWCIRSGTRPAPMNRFANILARKCDVPVLRKRHLSPAGAVMGPHSVVLWVDGCGRMPDTASEAEWLTANIQRFSADVNDYRGRES